MARLEGNLCSFTRGLSYRQCGGDLGHWGDRLTSIAAELTSPWRINEPGGGGGGIQGKQAEYTMRVFVIMNYLRP